MYTSATQGDATIRATTGGLSKSEPTDHSPQEHEFSITGAKLSSVYGAYSTAQNAQVCNNTVTITSSKIDTADGTGTAGYIYGGYSGQGSAQYNKITLEDVTARCSWIAGGYGATSISNNTVEIKNCSNVTSRNVYGGHATDGASSNCVTIVNSKISGNVYGGYSSQSAHGASDNTIELVYDNNVTSQAVEIAGDVWISACSEPSTTDQYNGKLNVYGSGHKIGGKLYANNATLNFYIPASSNGGLTADGSNTMLKVGNIANVKNSKLVAHLSNVDDVPVGSSITLLQAGTLYSDGLTTAVATDGLMNVDLQVNVDNNKITAYTTASAQSSTEEAKSPVETQISGISLVNSGSDMIAGRSFADAAAAVARSNADTSGGAMGTNGDGSTSGAGSSASSMTPFASIGGSNVRQKSGSYVDTKAWNISAGFAKEVQNGKGSLLFGPILEYGRGSYESHLDSGTVGNGDSSFWGIGGIVKQSYDNGLYLEGSARIGRMNNDYRSDDIGLSSVSYDNSATYYAMHMGAGRIMRFSDRNSLDVYGKLFYTHQNASSATLNTGHVYDFDAIDSVRTRLGCRYTFGLDDNNSLYAGLAWQHEFGGTANATIHAGSYSSTAPSPSVQGDTGILELGWKTTPASQNLELALGLEAYAGKQQGIGANASILWHF